MKYGSVPSLRIGKSCITHRRVVQINEFRIPTNNAILEWVNVHSEAKIPGLAVFTKNR